MLRKNISSDDFPNTELLYIDSHIMAECGLFYTVMAKGRIHTTEKELLNLNKEWGQNIKDAMGYTDFYSTVELADSLRLLCTEMSDGTFVLTINGIANVLSKVKQYQRSRMNISSFMIILDRMIKSTINSLSDNKRKEQLNGLKTEVETRFQFEPTISFNTNENGDKLAIELLEGIAEIYINKTYNDYMCDKEIGEFIRLINEREQKFHDILQGTIKIQPKESTKYLYIAQQIREDKIYAYKRICEHVIGELDSAKIRRVLK